MSAREGQRGGGPLLAAAGLALAQALAPERKTIVTSSVADRIRNERQRLELTQGAAATLASVSRVMWSRYEQNGVRQSLPGAAVLQLMAQHGFDVNYILTGARRGGTL